MGELEAGADDARPAVPGELTDVVGVYLTPPKNALVLCVDEKSQIQTLDRTQPGLPLKPGRCGTYTHDYTRHGTTTLFAALQLVEGRVIGQCYPRHRHQEFLKFLRRLDAEFPGGVPLHLILDNYGTHGHGKDPDRNASAPTPIMVVRAKLTRKFFFDLPLGTYVVSNLTGPDREPVFAQYVRAGCEREDQWAGIKALGCDHRLCEIFPNVAAYRSAMAERFTNHAPSSP